MLSFSGFRGTQPVELLLCHAESKNLNLRGLGADGSLEVLSPVCIIPRQTVKGVRPASPGDCQNKTLQG